MSCWLVSVYIHTRVMQDGTFVYMQVRLQQVCSLQQHQQHGIPSPLWCVLRGMVTG